MESHWAASDAIYIFAGEFSVFFLIIGVLLLADRLNRDRIGGKRLVRYMFFNPISTVTVLFIALVTWLVVALTESITITLFIVLLLAFFMIAAFPLEIRENGIYALSRKWFLYRCDLIPWDAMKRYHRDKHEVYLTLRTGKKFHFHVPPKIGPKIDAIMKRKMRDSPPD